MKRLILYIGCLLVAVSAMAQVDVSGRVVDKENTEPLPGASVVVKGADGKIKKFTTSKGDGAFAMTLPLTIELEQGTTLLKEVTVKADRIREQGDTITYGVSAFAQEQDRSIGDVLKRMPGIDVASSGKIQYQGEDINKFYIEGSDLLGGRYGIATNGISHEDVGAVEVMENHQPMQVLSGIAFSDKAAINLKLKDKAKATWTFHGDVGGGYSWQPQGALWDGELFAMAVMPGFQNITTLKTNNIGEDLSAQATDFFAASRGTELSRYVSVSLPGVPDLSRKRTLFNRSALLSSNALWKLGSGEFKAQVDYSFNRITAGATGVTTYFLDGGNRVVTENRDGTGRQHSLSGKFIYELNQKTAFVNNTLTADFDWDNVRLGVTGSLPNTQSASLPDFYVGNNFKLIKRFSGKHLVTFTSRNEWESLPQTLSVSLSHLLMRQHIRDHAFFTDESAAYAFSVKGVTVSLEGGVKGYFRTLDTELPELPDAIPGATVNVLNTNYVTVYATPKFEYWLKRVNLTLDVPLSFAHYTFDKALANRSEVYCSPSLSMNWKPNNRFAMSVSGGAGRSPMELNLIQPGYIMTDYRSFTRGTDAFYNSTSQHVSGHFSYKHTRRGLFANAFVMHSWSRVPYTMAQQLFGDYVVYSYAAAKSNGKMLLANGNVGKTLDFMRGSANVSGRFTRTDSHLLSENESVNSVGTSWAVGAKVNGSPLRWLSFDYRFDFSQSRVAMNGAGAPWLSGMENELLLNVMPHSKWEWHVSGEHYRNEIAAGSYKNLFLLDTKVVFKLNKRWEFSVSVSNILDQRTYSYTTYSQLTSYESRRHLRGRELLFTISLRK